MGKHKWKLETHFTQVSLKLKVMSFENKKPKSFDQTSFQNLGTTMSTFDQWFSLVLWFH